MTPPELNAKYYVEYLTIKKIFLLFPLPLLFLSVEQLNKGVHGLLEASLHEKYPNPTFFRLFFSCFWIECGDLLCKSSNAVQIRENTDQKISEFKHSLGSVYFHILPLNKNMLPLQNPPVSCILCTTKAHLLLQSWKIGKDKQNQLTNASWFWYEVVV